MSTKHFIHKAGILLLAITLNVPVFAQKLSAATDGERPPDETPQTQQFLGPLKLFDNLYYLGTSYVSAYLLVTSDGLIMIDSLYREFSAQALGAVRELGFDPADIRYLLVTHGHQDHAGGIEAVRMVTNATVAMSAADWTLAAITPDMTINDGDILTLGDTSIRFLLTPGHTKGVLSMQFAVTDGTASHEAFLFGGHNVTTNNPEDFVAFIASVQRLQADLKGIEVNLTSHPWAALIFQRAELLKQRKLGEPHPMVDGADFSAFLAERLLSANQRLLQLNNSKQ